MPIVEYPAGAAFPGVIGRTTDESTPAWPALTRAPEGSPNVVFVVLDDTGYGQLGCFGSPIATPNFDALAANGVRFRNMHTTALCSPSRSAIINGRNHHSNGMAAITELASGYPATTASSLARTASSPRCSWRRGTARSWSGSGTCRRAATRRPPAPTPAGRSGADSSVYGFLGGDTSQWYPELVYDNHQVEPPRSPEEGYHLTRTWSTVDRVHHRPPAGRPRQAVLPASVLRRDPCPASRRQRVG